MWWAWQSPRQAVAPTTWRSCLLRGQLSCGFSAHRYLQEPARDRAMVCGSLAFNKDVAAVLDGFGLEEGSNSAPGDYVIEKAFVG